MHHNETVTQYGSTVDAGQSLTVNAGRDITAIASQIDAKRDVSMSAIGDLTLASAADEQHAYSRKINLSPFLLWLRKLTESWSAL
ncbi:hemagglutinin repeat-containing protein [Pseudomonas frederiksbergensis]|uniref:hemagglutinin repeat-containing protein n=1 Tax=Pseudomonas frederiksbergensis TaxID=104087 RepID=UPI002181F486|nr:hemagglutinin repeat-containing protein [Pseudomonas frederiksbergensis]